MYRSLFCHPRAIEKRGAFVLQPYLLRIRRARLSFSYDIHGRRGLRVRSVDTEKVVRQKTVTAHTCRRRYLQSFDTRVFQILRFFSHMDIKPSARGESAPSRAFSARGHILLYLSVALLRNRRIQRRGACRKEPDNPRNLRCSFPSARGRTYNPLRRDRGSASGQTALDASCG